MHRPVRASPWTRHFFYRTEHVRTTWKFRSGLVAVVVLMGWLTSHWWTVAVARSLVCEESVASSDAILAENFDPDYLVLERAGQLRDAGIASRVLVPVQAHTWVEGDPGSSQVDAVAMGITDVIARLARVGAFDIVPVRQDEPISLNTARDILRFIEREHIRSVLVVSPLFRSRRSALIYGATLGRAGVTVRCSHVEEMRGVETWSRSWHGVQEVAEQWLKLQYYRWYVLPFRLH